MFFTTKRFWIDAVERAVTEGATFIVVAAGTDALHWTSLDWLQIFALGGIGAGLSLLKCFAAGAKTGTASFATLPAPAPQPTSDPTTGMAALRHAEQVAAAAAALARDQQALAHDREAVAHDTRALNEATDPRRAPRMWGEAP